MTNQEAMKLALEALISYGKSPYIKQSHPKRWANGNKAIKALEEALKQEQGEPVVGTRTWFEDGKVVTQNLYHSDVYTTPQQRTWVRLTDEEHTNIQRQTKYSQFMTVSEYATLVQVAVEAKLKEKNT